MVNRAYKRSWQLSAAEGQKPAGLPGCVFRSLVEVVVVVVVIVVVVVVVVVAVVVVMVVVVVAVVVGGATGWRSS
jgi:hypothetical protein